MWGGEVGGVEGRGVGMHTSKITKASWRPEQRTQGQHKNNSFLMGLSLAKSICQINLIWSSNICGQIGKIKLN